MFNSWTEWVERGQRGPLCPAASPPSPPPHRLLSDADVNERHRSCSSSKFEVAQHLYVAGGHALLHPTTSYGLNAAGLAKKKKTLIS